MKIVKYIINESGIPTLFRTDLLHFEMGTSAVSAGFAIVDYDALTDRFSVKCYGSSESLGVNSNRKDCLIIQNYLNELLCNLDFGLINNLPNSKIVSKKVNKRHRILVIDKNNKYPFLFRGLRKNKFVVDYFNSFAKISEIELLNSDMFFMVLYESKDVFELLKIFRGTTPVIIASENSRVLKKMKGFSCFELFDLSNKNSVRIELYKFIVKVFE